MGGRGGGGVFVGQLQRKLPIFKRGTGFYIARIRTVVHRGRWVKLFFLLVGIRNADRRITLRHSNHCTTLSHEKKSASLCRVCTTKKLGRDASKNDNFQKAKQRFQCSIFSDAAIFNAILFCVIKVFCSSFHNLIFWDGSINVIFPKDDNLGRI